MGAFASLTLPEQADTIPKRIQHWAETTPDRELFVFYHNDVRTAYSFRQVLELAGKFAGRLRREYGFHKGDVILNTLPNSPERLFTDLGTTLAGCVTIHTNSIFSDGQDFFESARNSGQLAVIVCPESNTSAWKILQRYVTRHDSASTASIKCDHAPTLRSAILVSRRSDGQRVPFLKELTDSTEEVFVEPNIRSEDIAFVFTTSGTTGYCKLVAKTHAEIIEMWTTLTEILGQQSRSVWQDTVLYNDRPFGWLGGYPFASYVGGDKRVLLDVFDSEGSKLGSDSWKIICHEKVDYSLIMPLDLDYMLNHTTGDTGYKMKLIICGGQPISKAQAFTYLSVSHEVSVAYGSTEAGILSFGVFEEKDLKDNYCHKVRPGINIRIVDDQGQQVKTGQVGTIEVTGSSFFFTGYLNVVENPDPKTVTSFTKDGWFKMDDSGFFDHDGNLYVLGRLKDVINYGSGNVYPSWLECKIIDLAGVSEICVVPVSDPVLHQNICAVVQPVPGSGLTEARVRAFCESIFLDDKATDPKPIPNFYLMMDKLPVTTSGKTNRKALQELAESKFGRK